MISYMIVRTYDTLDSVREDLRSSDLKMAIHSFMNINIGITYDLIASGDPSFAFAASPNSQPSFPIPPTWNQLGTWNAA